MGSQDILGFLKEHPFRPFRMRTVSGRVFDIRHPEMVRVGRTSVTIFTFVSDDPDVYDKFETVGLTLVENLTHIEAQAAS